MSYELRDAAVIEPRGHHRMTVFWLHGLGADGFDFAPIVQALALPSEAGVRFVFPHAPVRPVTVNGGFPMRAWYDILFPDLQRFVDTAGIHASIDAFLQLAATEAQRLGGWDRLIFAGFSQGGVIALQAALRCPSMVAGAMALSTYLPLRDPEEIRADVPRFPIFWGHGTLDAVVPYALGQSAVHFLQSLDHPVEWKSYPVPHSVCPEEIGDIRDWLLAILDAAS